MSDIKKIVFIVGPTAVGKSRLALCLAENIGGEIVICDSVQVYKEISIASAKPSPEDQGRIPHHLLDSVSIADEFDVVKFRHLAVYAIAQIHKRDKIPILVGGSGLYMQILLDGIFEGGGRDNKLRKKLMQQAEENGSQPLYQQLVEKDPVSAGKIHPHDIKRVVRALEVCMLNNQSMSERQKERDGLWGKFDIKIFCLNMDREVLYSNINKRVDVMFAEGIVDEVKAIFDKPLSMTAQSIIGVKEIYDVLQDKCSLEDAKEIIKMNSRRYAKRQLTWFRKEERALWLDLDQLRDEEVLKIMKEKLYE